MGGSVHDAAPTIRYTDACSRRLRKITVSYPEGGTGENAADACLRSLILSFDWAGSPLGEISSWPQSLRTTVDLVLGSRHAMCMAWGPELTFLYNDAYAAFLGPRHPAALGRSMADVWSEIWPDLAPLVASALAGEATWSEDLHLVMDRHGYREDTWWTFSYSPLRDDRGVVVGMLDVAVDTTHKVLSERRRALHTALETAIAALGDAGEIQAASARLLAEHLGARRVTFSEVGGGGAPAPARGHPDEAPLMADRLRNADAGIAATADLRAGRIAVCQDIAADPDWSPARKEAHAALGLGAVLDAPLLRDGALAAVLSVYYAAAHVFAAEEVSLVVEVAERAWAAVERARAATALRENEARMRFALNAGRLGSWELDLVTGALTTSEQCRANFGRQASDPFSYDDLRAAVHPQDRERMAAAVEHSIRTGADYDIEYRAVTPSGEVRWVQIRAQTNFAPNGTPQRMAGVSLDVTASRRDQEAMRESEQRLRFLSELDEALTGAADAEDAMAVAARLLAQHVQASRCAYADVDEDSDRFIIRSDYTSPGIASSAGTYRLELFGSRAVANMRAGQTLIVRDVPGELAPDDGRDMFQSIGIDAIICCPLIKDDRLVAMMAVHQDRPRTWTAGEVGLVEAVVERCWAHVQRVGAEARLRESEARYRTLFEAVDAGFCVITLRFDGDRAVDYRFDEANPAFEGQTGLVGVAGRWVSELVPDLESHWFDRYGTVARTGTPVRFEDGSEAMGRWFDVHAFRIGNAGRQQVAILFNDITARKQAEDRLRQVNETLEVQVAERTAALRRYHDIVDATAAPICAFDTDHRLIAFNKAHNDEFRRVNGFDTRLGDVFPDLFIPPQAAAMRRLMDRALAGESFTVVERFGRPEFGQPAWEIAYTPLRDEQGRVIGAFHLAMDISDRLRAEEELAAAQEALRQSQKMEAMGSLTGGVAHDFNNLLTPIVGSLDLLQRKGIGGEREQRLITGAIQSADRAKTLVQRLLAFARRQPLQPRPVDIGALVSGMAELVASTSGPQTRVVVDIADDLPAAVADQNQLEMAILNLSVNARDAMPEGGRLTITARVDETGGRHPAGLAPGRYVRLSVADTGTGMSAQTVERAIEPFFSTKGVGKGTGLGLSMVHGLAAQLGGALTIDSRLGVGTKVELWLPTTDARAQDVGDGATLVTGAAAGEALLVDDEEVVRASTADMLADLGYRVTEAASAEEALRLLAAGLTPDLLVTDHLMPGMNGTDLARETARQLASVRILIVSGYAELEGIAPDLPRLVKPFRLADLSAALADGRMS